MDITRRIRYFKEYVMFNHRNKNRKKGSNLNLRNIKVAYNCNSKADMEKGLGRAEKSYNTILTTGRIKDEKQR